MYHPYAQSPSALTEYLRQKLRLQCTKHLSRSHPTQVKQSIPLEHNRISEMDIGSIGDLKCSVKHILSMATNQPRVLHKLHTNACRIVAILQNFSNAM